MDPSRGRLRGGIGPVQFVDWFILPRGLLTFAAVNIRVVTLFKPWMRPKLDAIGRIIDGEFTRARLGDPG